MEQKQTWKSPRKIAEEERAYLHKRFETYMQDADAGKLPRALAIAALREEVDYRADLSTGDDAEAIA